MWFVGMILGAMLGGVLGEGMGALLGAIVGIWLGGEYGARLKKSLHPTNADDTQRRLAALEKNLLELNTRLRRLEQIESASVAATNVPDSAPLATTDTRIPPEEAQEFDVASLIVQPAPPREDADDVWTLNRPSTSKSTAAENTSSKIELPPVELENLLPTWWSKLFSGNILAKIGVVLLFFGVASALKLAVQHGMFPVPVRLLLGAVGGVAMIMFGWSRAQIAKHQMFGFALQGGGFAILYLLVYFMLTRYQMITPTWAFIGYTLLGVSCTLLAAKQDSLSLAVLGISGAFMSPVLASSEHGNHIILFSYFALLNVFVFALNWFKGWRQLNIVGFLFTLAIGMSWALRSYQPVHFASTEFFLVLFFLMYSLEPVFFALFRTRSTSMLWGDGLLLFGTPLTAIASQAVLMQPYEYGQAWSVFIAGLYYLALWGVLLRQQDAALKLSERSHLGIAVTLLTYAVPLAFGAQVTSAVWTLEGCAVLWLGIRQDRYLARWTGIALQLLAGGYFLEHLNELSHAQAWFNDLYLGSIITALAGMSSGLMLHRWEKKSEQFSADGLFFWGLAWLIGATCWEIASFVATENKDAAWLGFFAALVAELTWGGKRWNWRLLRQMIWLLFAALGGIAADTLSREQHVLSGALTLLYPATVSLYYWLLANHERDNVQTDRLPTLHLGMFWGLSLLITNEVSWVVAHHLAPDNALWLWLSYGFCAATLTLGTLAAHRQQRFPFNSPHVDYLIIGVLPLLFASIVWFVLACFNYSGGGSGLPYLPVLNPLDLGLILTLYSIHRWLTSPQPHEYKDVIYHALPAGAFLWVSTLAARLAHHWGGVTFDWDILLHDALMQALLSVIWTLTAIGQMIYASQHHIRRRWFIGFSLLSVVGAKLMWVDLRNTGTITWTASLIGIALLVIAASYFSPAPPKHVEADNGD